MTDQKLDSLLGALRPATTSVTLDTVAGWINTGRKKPRFHPLAWLSRVGWRWPN